MATTNPPTVNVMGPPGAINAPAGPATAQPQSIKRSAQAAFEGMYIESFLFLPFLEGARVVLEIVTDCAHDGTVVFTTPIISSTKDESLGFCILR